MERKGEEPKAQGDGEVCRRGGCKVASQMTTAYVARAVEYLKDVACDIRIAMRDCNVYSGAFCEDTSATAPGSAFEFPPCTRYKYPPSCSRGWRGRGKAGGQGDGEVC